MLIEFILFTFGGTADKDLFRRLGNDGLKDVGGIAVVGHQFGEEADVTDGQTQRVHLIAIQKETE